MDFRKKIKNFFIPTLQNQLNPYSLRYKTLLFVAIVAVGIELAFYAYVNMAFKQNLLIGNIIESIQTTIADILPQVIVEETNKKRLNNNEQALTPNVYLNMAAKLKVDDMIENGYFSHESPDGSQPWDWMKRVNYSYSYAGENLAVNFFDAKDVVNAWMESTDHRKNILDNNFTEIGIAAARGSFQGKDTVFVVQMFGRPAAPDNYSVSLAQENMLEKPPKTKPSSAPLAVSPEPTATSSDIIVATSTELSSSTTAIAYASPAKKISVTDRWLVSPRHIARDAYLVLLTYMFLVLIIPMGMIYYRHVSASRYIRFKEIFILFRRPITSAFVTFIFITVVMYLNFTWAQTGPSLRNMLIESATSQKY